MRRGSVVLDALALRKLAISPCGESFGEAGQTRCLCRRIELLPQD